MDIKKQKAFNEKMGKRQKFSKGGLIKKIGNRHYFDAGGVAGPGVVTTGGQTTQTGISGGISNFLGTNNQFQAGAVPIQAGTNADQLNQSYGQAQSGIGQQQQFVNNVNAVNGIQKQEQAGQGFSDIAAGRGPNVAQNQLNQATATNVQNQGALMASQRGASSNPALIARQAAQQGAATQQQAAGQSATLQAEQQQAALGHLANIGGAQVNQQGQALNNLNTSTQNEQGQLQGANANYNNSNVSMQSNLNNVNASTAAGNQQSSNALTKGVLSHVPIVGGLFEAGGEVTSNNKKLMAITHHYEDGGSVTTNFGPSGYSPPPSVSSPNIGTSSAGPDQASAWKSKEKSDGGMPSVPSMPGGKPPGAGSPGAEAAPLSDTTGGAASAADMAEIAPEVAMVAAYKGGSIIEGPNRSQVANYLHRGGETGEIPAMVSPGEIYLGPGQVKAVIEEGANPHKIGERIPGKAKVKGDSLKNDTVPKTLQEGGVVIPRHIMKLNDPEKSELFVRRAVHMKKAGKK